MDNGDLPVRKEGTKEVQKSSAIEKLSGRHTNTLAVFIIFLATLITFICYLILEDTTDETIVTGLLGILTTTLGYFIGKGSSD